MLSKQNSKPILIFALVLLIYFITSSGETPYDYFVRLAEAFTKGRYYLSQNPPWLSELIPSGDKYFVVYPPMPAILLIPFVTVFKNFQQQWLAHLLGSGIVLFSYKLALSIKKDRKLALWAVLFTGFGNIIWFLSAGGSAWYIGQITAAFFLIAAITESLNKKRAFLIGMLLGGAFLSRLHTVLSLPFFLYQMGDKKNKNWIKFAAGFLPFLIFNFFYNYIRFGVIWDKAYTLIPNLFKEPWYQQGLFHPSYIPRHLKIIFTSLPKFQKDFPFITPSWAGLSIWITTPAFFYSLWADIKERVVQLSWLSILLIALVIFSHGTTGFAQFGYRFAVDFYPFLIFLTIKGVAKTGFRWHHWFLLFASVVVNLWGVLWINKFGWIRF